MIAIIARGMDILDGVRRRCESEFMHVSVGWSDLSEAMRYAADY